MGYHRAVTDLRALRIDAGLSVRELAARAGTSHPTLIAYEQGRKVPRADTRDRIIRAAGYVVAPVGPLRRVVTDSGNAVAVELADVLGLADVLPSRRTEQLEAPVFPPRIGA
jgi:transcriptional regulator with XRE-family HTH domain